MPNRIIKESVCESKALSEVSFFAEDLYKRLITYADDYGRFNADFQILLARLYPREIQIVNINDIEDALTELVGAGKISFYVSSARDELYGCFPKWEEHQRIRDSKKRLPDPDDTSINDYYLRRHIPYALKKRIIERDKFKCQECGKYICAGETSAERLIKMGQGLFHIDHIVPVIQGGRATEENLRLLCPTCNLTRKKHFTFDEILSFTTSPHFAADCGENPQTVKKSRLNPIQSNTNSNIKDSARAREGYVNYADLPLEDLVSDPVLAGAVRNWIGYKDAKGQPYVLQSFQALISEVKAKAKKYGIEATVEIINTSMSSGYDGIIWNKLEKQETNKKQSGRTKNQFNNIEQHDYDFAEIERQILG